MQRQINSLILAVACLTVSVALGALSAHAGDTFTVIDPFSGGTGGGPSYSTLIPDAAGNLYGTTVWGGTINSTSCPQGCGVVFELSLSGGLWTETVLYSFTGGTDGWSPVAGVVFDASGNLYGTTTAGGTRGGGGTVFELSPSAGGWTKTELYSFTGVNDGSYPESVTIDASGNLYGVARQGGNFNAGVVFELIPSSGGWSEHTLHIFTGGKDGGYPNAGLVIDGSGNLYGTTSNGGDTMTSTCTPFSGCGVVFEVRQTSTGWRESVLHAFTGGKDGGGPTGVTLDAVGNLYGTAGYGGNTTLGTCVAFPGCGVVFKLTPATTGWRESVLHSLTGGTSGAGPESGVSFDSAGNLYGSTAFGGKVATCPYTEGCGTVFELTPGSKGGWVASLLHRFTNGTDGTASNGLFIDAAGNVFGATSEGGVQDCSNSGGCGAVFEISPAASSKH